MGDPLEEAFNKIVNHEGFCSTKTILDATAYFIKNIYKASPDARRNWQIMLKCYNPLDNLGYLEYKNNESEETKSI